MIHCSSVEGSSSPPNNGLLILGVEGFTTFEELDLRVRLATMVCVIVKGSKFWGFKEKKKRKE